MVLIILDFLARIGTGPYYYALAWRLSCVMNFSLVSSSCNQQLNHPINIIIAFESMDVLSTAASVAGVASIAVQLADSAKKLYDFWSSVKDAPDTIQRMTTDLQLLSDVLSRIALEAQSSRPDDTIVAHLRNCNVKLQSIVDLINKFEPGFASESFSIRKWSAVKAALKDEKLEKLLSAVESAKTTLIIVLQTSHG